MIHVKKNFTAIGSLSLNLQSNAMRSAAARGLNEHVRLQERQAVRLMAAQTKFSSGRVARVTKSDLAAPSARMEAAVVVSDHINPLGQETSRSWSRSAGGATAGDWLTKEYKNSFIVARYGGAIFARRPGAKKYPIVRLWGAFLPNELRRPTMPTLPAAIRFADRDFEKTVLKHLMLALG